MEDIRKTVDFIDSEEAVETAAWQLWENMHIAEYEADTIAGISPSMYW